MIIQCPVMTPSGQCPDRAVRFFKYEQGVWGPKSEGLICRCAKHSPHPSVLESGREISEEEANVMLVHYNGVHL